MPWLLSSWTEPTSGEQERKRIKELKLILSLFTFPTFHQSLQPTQFLLPLSQVYQSTCEHQAFLWKISLKGFLGKINWNSRPWELNRHWISCAHCIPVIPLFLTLNPFKHFSHLLFPLPEMFFPHILLHPSLALLGLGRVYRDLLSSLHLM